jgi:hypothetical protein
MLKTDGDDPAPRAPTPSSEKFWRGAARTGGAAASTAPAGGARGGAKQAGHHPCWWYTTYHIPPRREALLLADALARPVAVGGYINDINGLV